jgi:hypothetical protein
MCLLVLFALAGCVSPGDSAVDPPGETGETGARDCAPVDEAPEPTREGHPSDGWRWSKAGALFEDGEALDHGDGDLAPALVGTGGGLHLLFTRQRGSARQLWASSSADGVGWSEPVPVTGLGDESNEYPGLLFEDGLFRLWYGSGSFDYATSTDGIDFEPSGRAFGAGQEGGFDSLSVLYPHPVLEEGGLSLYYTGYDGVAFAIGRATSQDDGQSWGAGERLLERDPQGWDNAAVAMPAPLGRDDAPTFWYAGYDTSQTNPGPWRLGMLGAGGERLVSLPLAEGGRDAWSTRDPAVVPWGDGWLMVYAGMGDDGVYRLMSASSDVCS